MEIKYCPFCGTELEEQLNGQKICENCNYVIKKIEYESTYQCYARTKG
jgi:hypothetical protein